MIPSYIQGPDQSKHSGADRVNTFQATAVRTALYNVAGWNYGADTYIQFFDVAAAPAAGDRCKYMVFAASGQSFFADLGSGQIFDNGVFVASCPGASDGLYAPSTNDPADLQVDANVRVLRTS